MARQIIGKVGLKVNEKLMEFNALFDTGATKSHVSLTTAEEMGYVKDKEPKDVLLAVKGRKAHVLGYLTARVLVNKCELPIEHTFGVVEGLRNDVIVGMDIIEPYELALDIKDGRVKFKKYPPTLEIV